MLGKRSTTDLQQQYLSFLRPVPVPTLELVPTETRVPLIRPFKCNAFQINSYFNVTLVNFSSIFQIFKLLSGKMLRGVNFVFSQFKTLVPIDI